MTPATDAWRGAQRRASRAFGKLARGLLSALLVPGLAVWMSAAVASAQSNVPSDGSPGLSQAGDMFVVEGNLRNGTAGGAVPSDQPVRVVGFVGSSNMQSWEGVTDQDGHYRVDGVPRIDGATYAIGTEYADAAYVDRVDAPAPSGVATKDLTVYESVSTDPGIRFEQSAVVLSSVDEGPRTIAVLEIHSLVNPTDRAFVPRMDGPGGPAGLVVFPLPPNASDVTPDMGLDPSQLVQIDRGFASFSPVLPGRAEVVFRYRVPYADSALQFTRTVRYPTTSVQLLAPTSGFGVDSAQLTPAAETATIGDRQYRRLSGGPFSAGTALNVSITGLPLPGGPFARVPTSALVGTGICIALIALVTSWARNRRRKSADLEPDAIVEQVVALDLALSEGRVSEEEHRRARDALVQTAARRFASEQPAGAAIS